MKHERRTVALHPAPSPEAHGTGDDASITRIRKAEQRAADRVRKARVEARRQIDGARREAVARRQRALDDARREARSACERILHEADLQVRAIDEATDRRAAQLRERAARRRPEVVAALAAEVQR